MKQTMHPISIVVPTLNEAGNLPTLFRRIDESLTPIGIPYEIIVIDDHSIDATRAIALNADPKYSVQLFMKQGKPGKAFSLLEGFAAANHELVCMIDADLQYPPETIKLMYHKLQYCQADIVLTNRIEQKTSPLRRLFSYSFNLLFIRLLFGMRYDTQSGLKLFRKSILRTMSITPSPWTFDLEFIVKALEQDNVIVTQDMEFSERLAGTPKIHLISASWEIARGSIRLWRQSSIKQVKTSYRHSVLLQRGLNVIFVALLAGLAMSVVPVAKTQALDLQPLTGTIQSIPDLLPQMSTPISTVGQTVAPAATTPAAMTVQLATAATDTVPSTVTPGSTAPATRKTTVVASTASASATKSLSDAVPVTGTADIGAGVADYYMTHTPGTALINRLLITALTVFVIGLLLVVYTIVRRVLAKPTPERVESTTP